MWSILTEEMAFFDQVSRLDDFANACLASQQQVGGTASAPAIYGFFGSGYLVALCSDQRLRWSSDAPHRLGTHRIRSRF